MSWVNVTIIVVERENMFNESSATPKIDSFTGITIPCPSKTTVLTNIISIKNQLRVLHLRCLLFSIHLFPNPFAQPLDVLCHPTLLFFRFRITRITTTTNGMVEITILKFRLIKPIINIKPNSIPTPTMLI